MRGFVLGAMLAVAGVLWAQEPRNGVGRPEAEEHTPMLLSAYLPDYRVAGYDVGRAAGCSELIYFSLVPGADGSLPLSADAEGHLRELRAATRKIDAKLLVSLGGWGRSAGFAPLAADPAARDRLAESLLALAGRFELDGFDLDWEHPTGPEQNRHAGELAQRLAAALRPRGLLLTAAVAEWQPLPAAFFAAVDRVHLMAYDAPGRHATPDYAATAMDRLIARGVPAGKILLGLPFYGRKIEEPRTALSYAEILSRWSPAAEANEAGGYWFDSAASQSAKLAMARERDLAGVMVWELAHDTHGPRSLLASLLHQTGRKPAPPPVCPLP